MSTGAGHATGNLRIADSGSQWRVRVSNAKGSVTSAAATLTVVPVQTGYRDGPGAQALFDQVDGMTVDANGNVTSRSPRVQAHRMP